MNRIAVSATIGILAGVALAGAYFGAPYAGYQIAPTSLMVIAASVAFGSAISVAAVNLAKAAEKSGPSGLMTMQLKRATNLVLKIPGRDGALDLTIRADQKIDQLEVVRHPETYKTKDIAVRLKGGGSSRFNPVELVHLFVALSQQPGFLHLLLLDKNDECIGYLPGFAAKREFTGPNPETAVTKYVVNVFEDDSNSVTLREIGGAGKFDTISDEAKVSDVLAKMAGGFRLLVVLKNNYHRRPVGVVNFNDFMIGAVKDSAGLEASPAALTIGAFR